MSDLIRREDVFKAIVGLTTHKTVDDIEIFCEDSVAGSEGWLGGIRDALREVEYIPSAEPERKKGEWIDGKPYVNSHWRVCSVCHESAPESSGGYYFCPHCGADMRGDHE